MSWWLDEAGPFTSRDPDNIIYLCEDDDDNGDLAPDDIQWRTTDRPMARALCARFNRDCLTRAEAAPILDEEPQ